MRDPLGRHCSGCAGQADDLIARCEVAIHAELEVYDVFRASIPEVFWQRFGTDGFLRFDAWALEFNRRAGLKR